ncbi:MAG: TIGR00300 family protein [Chthoniobacterales bacterium]
MFSETVELRGHIIDSLILPKVLDEILTRGCTFKIEEVRIGQNRVDQSYARVHVSAETAEKLDELILRVRQHGAAVIEHKEAQLAPAPGDGIFPDDFYVTTNQQTFVRVGGKELEVLPSMMDCAIRVDRADDAARTVRFYDVRKGDEIVVGHQGTRIEPRQRPTSHADVFQFLNTNISAERPKFAVIRELAHEFKKARSAAGKILVVAGPAVIHTGAGEHLEQLIELGYVDRLFAGNGLAVYDIESALYGTALGVNLEDALVDQGHTNHLRAINAVRQAGGIAAAVEKKILTHGVMHACVQHNVDIVLSGSIRDDGPIPGVTTDAVEAQKIMREKVRDVTLVLILGTMLHSIAVANMLSAAVKIVVVDIDPSAVAKIASAQSFQSIGLVTDVEPFLRELVACLEK